MAPYTIGLWGDLPYSDIQATQGVPNLIAVMNDSDIEFSVHDGDLKAGSGVEGSSTPSTCSDAMYVQALGYLNSLKSRRCLRRVTTTGPTAIGRPTAASSRWSGST